MPQKPSTQKSLQHIDHLRRQTRQLAGFLQKIEVIVAKQPLAEAWRSIFACYAILDKLESEIAKISRQSAQGRKNGR